MNNEMIDTIAQIKELAQYLKGWAIIKDDKPAGYLSEAILKAIDSLEAPNESEGANDSN